MRPPSLGEHIAESLGIVDAVDWLAEARWHRVVFTAAVLAVGVGIPVFDTLVF